MSCIPAPYARRLLLATFLGAAIAPASRAGDVVIYRCTDASGALTLQNAPCPKGMKQEQRTMQGVNTVPMAPVLVHALQQAGVQGTVVLLQATSPLRTPADIRAAVDLFATGAHGLVMSVTEADRGVLKWGRLEGSRFVPLSSPEHCFANRQSLPPVVRPNGAVYVFDAARLIATGERARNQPRSSGSWRVQTDTSCFMASL